MKRVLDSKFPILVIGIVLIVHSCSSNSITGRFQVAFLPETELRSIASQEYREFIGQHRVLLHQDHPKAELVRRVGEKLTASIKEFYADDFFVRRLLETYQWEYTVIESPEVNAWCLPGGKIIVYSGLLSVTRNESSLAIVLGHEIAHALAKHGNERMSRAMVSNGMEIVGKVITAGHLQSHWIFQSVFDQASRLKVLLPNLRKQELEADKLGLTFTAVAGYDPREAISLWHRMHRSGYAPPELLSTHPSEERRIRELKCFMPHTLKYLKKR